MKTIQGTKYIWQLPEVQEEQLYQFAAAYNLSLPVMHTLLARGLTDKVVLDDYLFSSFAKDVYHSSTLKDADKAVARIVKALEAKEKILIFGDYDVDGITSSAMMMLCLQAVDAQVNFFLPNRARDGYGLSTKIIERAAKNGYTLVITVDNGITAHDAVNKANEFGIDVIITDHHKPHAQVPDAFAIINPHQDDCPYPFKQFAGVGVTFKLLSLLYEKLNKPLSPRVYELLLLGTIADVVPLKGENRFWVRHGLQHINQTSSVALTILKNNVQCTKSQLSASDIGFSIAPQINALGRLDDPRDGVRFLLAHEEQEVLSVGKTLFSLNETRKKIERSIFAEVEAQITRGEIDIATNMVIIAQNSTWPPGVIGLVASRVVAAYNRPVILLHVTSSGIAKGSCRSIPGFNFFEALDACADVLTQFGGHAMAAGLSLETKNIPALQERLNTFAATKLTPEDLVPKLLLDAEIKLADTTKNLLHDLELLEPFGNENRQPYFYLKGISLVEQPTVLKDVHVKCKVFADGVIKPLLFFNRPDLIALFLEKKDEQFDCAVQITANHWQGRTTVELIGLDIAWY